MSRALVIFEIALSLRPARRRRPDDQERYQDSDHRRRLHARRTSSRLASAFRQTLRDTAAQRQFFEQLESRLTTIPGVRARPSSSELPGLQVTASRDFGDRRQGLRERRGLSQTRASTAVSPASSTTFGIRAVQGRSLHDEPIVRTRCQIAIVNQAFAAKYFHGGDPIGRRMRLGGSQQHAAVADDRRRRSQHVLRRPASTCARRSSTCRSRSITRISLASPCVTTGAPMSHHAAGARRRDVAQPRHSDLLGLLDERGDGAAARGSFACSARCS